MVQYLVKHVECLKQAEGLLSCWQKFHKGILFRGVWMKSAQPYIILRSLFLICFHLRLGILIFYQHAIFLPLFSSLCCLFRLSHLYWFHSINQMAPHWKKSLSVRNISFFTRYLSKLCQAFLRKMKVVQAYLCRYYRFCHEQFVYTGLMICQHAKWYSYSRAYVQKKTSWLC